MSEFAEKSQKRVDALVSFVCGIIETGNGLKLIEKYKDELNNILPVDVVDAFDRLLLMNYSQNQLKIVQRVMSSLVAS